MTKEGNFLLYAQLVLLLLLFYLGNLKNVFNNFLLLGIFAAGLVVLIVSYLNIGPQSYSPFPQPTKANVFSQNGLYRYLRHPMYSGLIVLGIALVFSSMRLETFIVLVALIVILNLKADQEEELLSQKYKEYQEYITKTKKFIPYLY